MINCSIVKVDRLLSSYANYMRKINGCAKSMLHTFWERSSMQSFICIKITSSIVIYAAVICCWLLKVKWNYATLDWPGTFERRWESVALVLAHRIGWPPKWLRIPAATTTRHMAADAMYGHWGSPPLNWAMGIRHFWICIRHVPCSKYCVIRRQHYIDQPIGRRTIMTSLPSKYMLWTFVNYSVLVYISCTH